MLIACLLELFFLLFFVWPKQPLQSKCTLAQGNSGLALPVLAPALAGASSAPAPGAACSACIPHPAFRVSFHLMHLLWGKKKDDSCPKPPVGSTASVLSPVILLFVQVTAVKVPSSPRIAGVWMLPAVSL